MKMKKLVNETRTMNMFVGSWDDILINLETIANGHPQATPQCPEDFCFPLKDTDEEEFTDSLAVVVDLHYWLFVKPEDINEIIRSNKLRRSEDYNWTMPKSPMEWLTEMGKLAKAGKHGTVNGNAQILSVFGNGQPCHLLSTNGEYLGERIVSKAMAEFFLSLGIIPIVGNYVEEIGEAWNQLVKSNHSWGLHDHKGAHC